MRLSCAALLVFAGTSAFAGHNIVGSASIIDGDTVEIHGNRVRLWGIDAPESNQLCRRDDSLLYRCGAKSANDLAAFIAGRPLTCAPTGSDRYGRTVASCEVADVDVADWLVRQGLALDWPRYSHGRYAEAQKDAQHNKRGIWAGSLVEPWRYRDCVRLGGRPETCSD